MPTQYTRRTWCRKCADWTIHHEVGKFGEEHMACDNCETVFTTINTSEIPVEKVLEQRKRYSERKSEDFRKLMMMGMSGSFGSGWGGNVNITEEDAGQKAIDDERAAERKRQEEEYKENRRMLTELYNDHYRKLGRNDKCACGSGKKYKQCCIERFKEIV